ncbi:sure-like protein [Schizopora paradoxa]|uniref:Sure-like protein n=1 Tax=Schizopora paradoxa TaxID=27342 RepID=A0A0H2RBL7_9AGAM|nr:sure-like protein [Schizopora paradoxa]
MRAFLSAASVLFSVLLAVALVKAQTKIVLTNDDGWAVANIRAQNSALIAAGFNVVLSAPAENESGTGSDDEPATTVGANGCEFQSCPAGAPPTGNNASDTRLNYVNSFPVTSVRFGIQTVAPLFFDGDGPDFVVSGPNVGTNLGGTTGPTGSGTVGAACEAAKEGVPSVAFSGSGGSQVSFTTLSTSSASTTTADVFGALGVRFVEALLASSASPILPAGVTLNVNYRAASGSCTSASAFDFVFTRVTTATKSTPADVNTCGTTRLPTEANVVNNMPGCLASVSVMNATTKADVDASTQEFVLNRIGSSFFTCV